MPGTYPAWLRAPFPNIPLPMVRRSDNGLSCGQGRVRTCVDNFRSASAVTRYIPNRTHSWASTNFATCPDHLSLITQRKRFSLLTKGAASGMLCGQCFFYTLRSCAINSRIRSEADTPAFLHFALKRLQSLAFTQLIVSLTGGFGVDFAITK